MSLLLTASGMQETTVLWRACWTTSTSCKHTGDLIEAPHDQETLLFSFSSLSVSVCCAGVQRHSSVCVCSCVVPLWVQLLL